jgi:macrolide transport system ATP-binding/permease protein
MGANHFDPCALSGAGRGSVVRSLRAWLLRLAGVLRKEHPEQQLDLEMHSHLEMHVADILRAGMTAEQARREALIRLGGIEQTKELCRERRGLPVMETFLQDVRGARYASIRSSRFATSETRIVELERERS